MSTRRILRVPDENQKALLAAWTALALDRMPYLASVLYSLRPVDAPGSGTFAVDAGHRIYIDFAAVAPWGAGACAQSLLHEAMHLAYGHDCEARDMNVQPGELDVWNLAADASINDDLRDAGCDYLAEVGILPEKIGCEDYQTASQYMVALRVRLVELDGGNGDEDKEGSEDQGDSDSPGDDEQGSGNQDGPRSSAGHEQEQDGGNGDDDEEGPGAEADSSSPNGGGQGRSKGNHGDDAGQYQGCGSGAGASPAPWELPDGDDLNGQAPAAGAGEKAVIAQTLAQDIQEASKHRGTMPAGLTEWAGKTLEKPKVPWQRVLAPLIRRYTAIRVGEFDTTYARRNHRRPYTPLGGGRVVNPGVFAPVPQVVYVRDTSGSMTADDLNLVGAEIESIAGRLGIRGRDLLVIDTDAQAYSAKPYKALDAARGPGPGRHGHDGLDRGGCGPEALGDRRRHRRLHLLGRQADDEGSGCRLPDRQPDGQREGARGSHRQRPEVDAHRDGRTGRGRRGAVTARGRVPRTTGHEAHMRHHPGPPGRPPPRGDLLLRSQRVPHPAGCPRHGQHYARGARPDQPDAEHARQLKGHCPVDAEPMADDGRELPLP